MPNTAASSTDDNSVILDTEAKWLHVVAGVIFNAAGDAILLARRPDDKHQGGKWEFPGGKVEVGEKAEHALSRELEEELGILVDSTSMLPFVEVRHCYSDKNIFLDVWQVNAFSGEPYGREGQTVRWFAHDELATLDFPEANALILEKLLQRE